jgi:hypothetical protein
MKLPHGIHGDCWSTIKKLRTDKFSLVCNEFARIVPKTLHKSNKVIVKVVSHSAEHVAIV